MKTYKIFYISGNDTIYEHGEFELKETDKTINFILVKQGFYTSSCLPKGDLTYRKSKGYTLENLKEVFYPMKAGIPHYIEETSENKA